MEEDNRVRRINGVKTHLDALSGDELQNMIDYATVRRERADNDVFVLTDELMRRTPDNVIPFPAIGQLALDGFEDGPIA